MPLFRTFLVSAAVSAGVAFADDAAAPATPGGTPKTDAAAPVAPVVSTTSSKKPADGKEITAAEIDSLIARLSQIRGVLDAESRRAQGEALKALNVAVADNTKAIALFIDCTRVVEFDKPDTKLDKPDAKPDKAAKADKTDKTGLDFDTWRKQNDDKLHDPGFASAIRIQLRYLKLCLECDTDEKAEAAFPSIVALQDDAIKALATSGAYASALRDDVFSGDVAKRFAVTKIHPEGWSGGALDLDGHFGRAVKLALDINPDGVPALWDARLKLERALAEAMDKNATSTKRKKAAQQQQQQGTTGKRQNGPHSRGGATPADADAGGDEAKSVNDFETLRLPRLLWSMSEDFLKAGLHRRGFESMFAVINKYPKHPDVSDWVDRITELAKTMKEGGDTDAVESKVKGPGAGPKINGTDTGRPSRRRGN